MNPFNEKDVDDNIVLKGYSKRMFNKAKSWIKIMCNFKIQLAKIIYALCSLAPWLGQVTLLSQLSIIKSFITALTAVFDMEIIKC